MRCKRVLSLQSHRKRQLIRVRETLDLAVLRRTKQVLGLAESVYHRTADRTSHPTGLFQPYHRTQGFRHRVGAVIADRPTDLREGKVAPFWVGTPIAYNTVDHPHPPGHYAPMRALDISAAIVLYRNPQQMVERAIESLFATKLRVHLDLVDNSPTTALSGLASQRPQISYFHTGANLGFGRAHNLALHSLARDAEYHLVLNPDVEFHPGALDRLYRYLQEHPDVGLVCPKIQNPNGTLQYLNKRPPTFFDLFIRRFLPHRLVQLLPALRRRTERYTMQDIGYDHPVNVPYMSGCCMLFRRSVFCDLGGFDERFFLHLEDADISLRTNQISNAMYCPEATITHLWQRGSHNDLRQTLITLHSAFRFFRKWGWRFA